MRPPKKPASAWDRALRWLAVRARSENELRSKLRRAEVGEAEIEATIARLQRLGYLDDARFARARAESLLAFKRLGPRGVERKLAAAGIAREVIREAVSEAMSERDELSLAFDALRRKHPAAIGTDDPRLRARAARYLISRGFSGGVVARALRLEEAPEGEDD
jgi:regulatory protein